jgi:hypothetical protein
MRPFRRIVFAARVAVANPTLSSSRMSRWVAPAAANWQAFQRVRNFLISAKVRTVLRNALISGLDRIFKNAVSSSTILQLSVRRAAAARDSKTVLMC